MPHSMQPFTYWIKFTRDSVPSYYSWPNLNEMLLAIDKLVKERGLLEWMIQE